VTTNATDRAIGLSLVVAAAAVLVPYGILTAIFDYPDILRQDAGAILSRFHQGGATLIWVWWAFAIVGLPLLAAYVLLGQRLEGRWPWARLATTLGVISVVVQVIGLLRWTFVVPVLARTYATTSDPAAREAAKAAFQTVHQLGGVLLGEHLGQLFTIGWTVMIAAALDTLRLMPKWVTRFGYVAAAIYLLAQAELFATVIPTFPVWDLAGLIGSTLWLAWLIVVGWRVLRDGLSGADPALR
jgi:hypothetical protein